MPRENLSLKAELLLTDWVALISLAVVFEIVSDDFFACMHITSWLHAEISF